MPKLTWLNRFSEKQKIIAGAVLAVFLVAMTFMIWLTVSTAPADPNRSEAVKVDVRQGASIEETAALLASQKLIKNSLAFSLSARLSGAKIEAGSHMVSAAMSGKEILKVLSSASHSNYDVTILPGQTLPEIKETLLANGFSSEEIDQAFSKKYEHPLLASKPADASLEGYIFPDTYEMTIDDKVEDLIQKSFDHLYEKLQRDGSLTMLSAQGLSLHDALTLASIVAQEAPDDANQKMIAAVFQNRLGSNIRLGSDVTYKYAYKMGYCVEDSPSCDSVYNTRIHEGLPPGPISNMNYSSIQAVLHPTPNDNLYFVAGDDGQIYYAKTEDEHKSNIYNYCHELCQ